MCSMFSNDGLKYFLLQQERVLGTLNCKTIFQGHIGMYSGGGVGMGMMTSSKNVCSFL